MSSKSSYSTILRYTRVLAALGSVVAGIRHSCSGYAGFWPWLLAAGPRRQGSILPRRAPQAWAWRFFGLKEASHHTVRVASHARGHAWHPFYYLIFSILAMRLPSRFDKRHAKIWFCRSWRKKFFFFFAEPGLSEFRAVSAQKRTFWSPVQGLTPKQINAKRRISNLTYKQ